MSLFEPIFEALNLAQVRYVVVGGFATVLHGHARLTAAPLALADPATRHQWIHDKGIRIASIRDLIRLKRLAGRPQDLADVEALEIILRRKEGRDGRTTGTRGGRPRWAHSPSRMTDRQGKGDRGCCARFFYATHPR